MLDLDLSLAAKLLVWIISGGGAGVLAFWIWSKVEKAWPGVAGISGELKRWIVLAIGAVLSTLAFLCLGWFGVVQLPSDPQGWVNTLVAVIGIAYMSSQKAHGRFVLSKRGNTHVLKAR